MDARKVVLLVAQGARVTLHAEALRSVDTIAAQCHKREPVAAQPKLDDFCDRCALQLHCSVGLPPGPARGANQQKYLPRGWHAPWGVCVGTQQGACQHAGSCATAVYVMALQTSTQQNGCPEAGPSPTRTNTPSSRSEGAGACARLLGYAACSATTPTPGAECSAPGTQVSWPLREGRSRHFRNWTCRAVIGARPFYALAMSLRAGPKPHWRRTPLQGRPAVTELAGVSYTLIYNLHYAAPARLMSVQPLKAVMQSHALAT